MYKKNYDFYSDITELQTIFLDTENGMFYILPFFANLVFRFLLNGKDIDYIKTQIAKIPDVPNDYEKRVDCVFNDLIKYNLIVESDKVDLLTPTQINDLIIQGLQESNFAYKIEPSNDVQKLLLDDPIHDVSLDGWTPIAK